MLSKVPLFKFAFRVPRLVVSKVYFIFPSCSKGSRFSIGSLLMFAKKPHNKDLSYTSFGMAEFICPDCGKGLYHENETTLEIEKGVHKKFCTKIPGAAKSYMHRGSNDNESIVGQRTTDDDGKPILKR